MSKFPLNQTYQQAISFKDRPELEGMRDDYFAFCQDDAKWHKVGRWYDCILSLSQNDFEDKTVCELGARDSIFSSYLTKMVKKIHVSDSFVGWGDLGSLEVWNDLWKAASYNPDRLVSEKQDMRNLTYEDNSMDIVVSFSAIEHIFNGDALAAKEMGRVCKPDGTIIIGTELCKKHVWHSGSYFYDENSLFRKIIEPTGFGIKGDYDFSIDNADMANFAGLDFTSMIFSLEGAKE